MTNENKQLPPWSRPINILDLDVMAQIRQAGEDSQKLAEATELHNLICPIHGFIALAIIESNIEKVEARHRNEKNCTAIIEVVATSPTSRD